MLLGSNTYGKVLPPYLNKEEVALLQPDKRSDVSLWINCSQASKIILLKYPIDVLFQRRWFNVASAIQECSRFMVPLSFGCDQIVVWLAKKNGNTLFSIR